MTISISGQVPAQAQNGMYDLEPSWTKDRTPDPVLAVVRIERAKLHFDDDKQVWSATLKLSHIEPLVDESQAEQARKLLEAACGTRGGSIDVELDIDGDEK